MERPIVDQLRHVRICISKSKHELVLRLEKYNKELRDILGFKEWLVSVTDTGHLPRLVAIFELVRQQASKFHSAIELHLRCENSAYKSHRASPRLDADIDTNSLCLLFTLDHGVVPCPEKREIPVPLTRADPSMLPKLQILRESTFSQVQLNLIEKDERRVTSRAGGTKASKSTQSNGVTSTLTTPSTSLLAQINASSTQRKGHNSNSRGTSTLIDDLCMALRTNKETDLGMITSVSDDKFHLMQSSAPDSLVRAELTSLAKLLEENRSLRLDLTREQRFKMAANIGCTLLQVQRPPWLSKDWTKNELYFLADARNTTSISNENPYVSRTYPTSPIDPLDCGDSHLSQIPAGVAA